MSCARMGYSKRRLCPRDFFTSLCWGNRLGKWNFSYYEISHKKYEQNCSAEILQADGFVARKYNMKSVLGTILDPAADKALMTTLAITLAIKGLLPRMCSSFILKMLPYLTTCFSH